MDDPEWLGEVRDWKHPLGERCRLVLDGKYIVARLGDGKTIKLDTRHMKVRRDAMSKARFIFASTKKNGPTMTTDDAGLHDAWVAKNAVAPLPDVVKRRPMSRAQKGILLGTTLLIGAAAGVAALLPGPLSRLGVLLAPGDVDRRMAAAMRVSVEKDFAGAHGKCGRQDPVVGEAINAAMTRLRGATGREGPVLKVNLCDSARLNAISLPDGEILISTALLRRLKSTEQLAAVLAHETAHVRLRHGVEAAIKQKGIGALSTWLLPGSTQESQPTGTPGFLGGQDMVGDLDYSMEMELAADAEAARLLSAAKIDPANIVTVLQAVVDSLNQPRTAAGGAGGAETAAGGAGGSGNETASGGAGGTEQGAGGAGGTEAVAGGAGGATETSGSGGGGSETPAGTGATTGAGGATTATSTGGAGVTTGTGGAMGAGGSNDATIAAEIASRLAALRTELAEFPPPTESVPISADWAEVEKAMATLPDIEHIDLEALKALAASLPDVAAAAVASMPKNAHEGKIDPKDMLLNLEKMSIREMDHAADDIEIDPLVKDLVEKAVKPRIDQVDDVVGRSTGPGSRTPTDDKE